MVRNKWISHSGCHWDNIHGAGVQGKFDEEVFENYTKNHPLICPFKNSGWEFYELMLDIMPNGASHGNNAFTPSTLNFGTDSAQQVANRSPAPDGETLLEFPDSSRYSLNISQWCETLPTDNTPEPPPASGDMISNMPSSQVSPPPPSSSTLPSVGMSNVQFSEVRTPAACVPSSTGKRSHTKMINDDVMSAFPFANASNISVPTCNKCLQLSEAMDCARSLSSHHTHKAAAVSDPMAAGLQGSINFLTSLMHSSMSAPSATRMQVLQLLSKEDHDLPRALRAFIQHSIAQSLGFAEVYIGTTNKDEWLEYVQLKRQLSVGVGGSRQVT
ncbi:hypothetical protein BKA83DRAFT_13567 [Pisolithus microcarpus]|nr:hypothetical protein BKA83DRAFT_13567 [Pisolithus microcarpus]